MEDRHKYRAWDQEENEWVYFGVSELLNSFALGDTSFCGDTLLINLGQYTGLKDKNGKLIYEGNVLEICTLGEVIWWEKAGAWGWKPLDKGEPIQSLYYRYTQDLEEFKIIGNIYENPELLGQRK